MRSWFLLGTPPLSARDCADFMGFTPHWIRKAITDGVSVHGVVVKLEAEALTLNRRTYRIHEEKFAEFLQAIGWKHLPRSAHAAGPHVAPAREAAASSLQP